jgi:hypothetical protein
MEAAHVHATANQLWEALGPAAIASAARKALESDRRGDREGARTWRRIEEALRLMRGPPYS